MSSKAIWLALALASFACADTLALKNGRVLEGTYVGGDERQIRMKIGDSEQTFDRSEVAQLSIGGGAARPAPDEQRILRPDRALSPEPAPVPEIPEGTRLVIRMIDSVDSERDHVGQTFRASIDQAVVIRGDTLIPRGADVVVKLVDDKRAGRLTGRPEVKLDLSSVTVRGKQIDLLTQVVTREGDSQTTNTAKRAGTGAVLGAVIGAIAGGGKGAAIGAAAGGGAGTASAGLSKPKRVRIPSETRLTFTLESSVRL